MGLCWTPTGKIVYSSFSGDSQVISIMEADGTNEKQLTPVGNRDSLPTVTPDGRYIIFQSDRAGQLSVWRMDIDGGNPTQLTTGKASEPHCCADGRWVVYVSGNDGVETLWKVPLDGGDAVQLADKPSEWPAVSPDGKMIACSYSDPQANIIEAIAVFSSEGGKPIKVLDIPPKVELRNSIRWAEDGRALMYRDARGIWRQAIEGGPPKKISGLEEELIYNFAWSPDGKRFAYARGVYESDVVLIRNFR